MRVIVYYQLFQALKENFAIFSAAAVVVGVALATVFLATYLQVFDWRLLWFVQYTDILTFALVALGLISGTLGILINVVNIGMTWNAVSAQTRKLALKIVAALLIALFIFGVWSSSHSGEEYFHIIWGAVALATGLAAVGLVIRAIQLLNSGEAVVNFKQFIWGLSVLIFIEAGILGQYLGYEVRESKTSADIATKSTTMTGMKVVIVMSRHTVLLKDKEIFIVPTADIVQIHKALPLIGY